MASIIPSPRNSFRGPLFDPMAWLSESCEKDPLLETDQKTSGLFSHIVASLISYASYHYESLKRSIMKEFKHEKDLIEQIEINTLKNQATVGKITIEKNEGITIYPDQFDILKKNQKWIVHFPSNAMIWQDFVSINHYIEICNRRAGLNKPYFLTVNYRTAKFSDSPLTFQDLVDDGMNCIKLLTDQGVKPENILIEGLSLGGAVACHVAKESPECYCSAQNTFSKLSTLAPSVITKFLQKHPDNKVDHQRSYSHLFLDTITTPFRLTFRCLYFLIQMLSHLIQGELLEASEDLKEIAKATLIKTALTITSLIGTGTILFAKKIAEFNSKYLYLDDSRIIDKILKLTHWEIDTKQAYDSLDNNRKIAFNSKEDETIPKDAALITEEDETSHWTKLKHMEQLPKASENATTAYEKFIATFMGD